MTTRFHYPPRSTRGSVLGFSAGQIALCVAGVITAVVALNLLAVGHLLLAGSLFLVGALLIVAGLLRLRGRRVTAWAPITVGAVLQRLMRQDRYRGGIFAPDDGARLDLPGPAAGYRWLEAMAADGKTEIGLLHHRVEETVTAALLCTGANFLLADAGVQDQRLADWAGALNILGGEYAECGLVRWALTSRAVPDTGNRAHRYLTTQAVDTTAAAYRSLASLTMAAAPGTLRHEVYLSVVFDTARMSAEITDAGGDTAAVAVVVCERLAGIEQTVAEAGIGTHGWLSPRRYAAVLRTQFDPDDQAAVDLRGIGQPEDSGGGVAPAMAGPTAAEQVGWGCYRHDSGISQTLWVYEMPRQLVGATWLTPLYTRTTCRRTVTLVAQPVPASVAHLASRRERVAHAGDETTRRKLRLVRTARDVAEASSVEQIDREQAAGHVRYRYALLVTVTADTEQHLRRDVRSVRRLLGRAGCEAVVLHGEQDQAFAAAALPLARGLIPMRGWWG